MQTSAKGVAALEQEEGVVLRAYRCPAGHWTIGAGLTAASGVVKPKPGMVITQVESTELTEKALRKNYEPAVEAAMTSSANGPIKKPQQCEFDAGVSFHWNTGAISRASWVKLWKAKAGPAKIRAAMILWNKGGGRVLPGLTARREREAAMLLGGVYPRIATSSAAPLPSAYAKWGMSMSGEQIVAIREGLRLLGYEPGAAQNAVEVSAARKFQSDHNLTVDGIIGRATLSTLQRRLDARVKVKAPVAAVAAVVPAATTGAADHVTNLPWAGDASLLGVALWSAHFAWTYRDVIAAKIANKLPRVAALLRSF